VVRVFHAKLKSLIKEIRGGVLGDWAAHLYTIEFQKHGLPCYILNLPLLFLLPPHPILIPSSRLLTLGTALP
jgi:Helitron helicase-like domain at N-terminus